MKIINIESEYAQVEFPEGDFLILNNALNEVFSYLDGEGEFQTPMGMEPEEALALQREIQAILGGSGSFETGVRRARVDLGKDRVVILGNALNEVSHGFEVEPFEARMGAGRERVTALLKEIQELCHEV